jgi:hypothetical protein
MNYEKELKKEYAQIMKKLQNPNVSESYLDNMIKIMSEQLQAIPTVKAKDKKVIKRAYNQIVEANKKENIKDKALSQLKKLWKFDEDIDNFQAQALENRAFIALDLINLEEVKETEDKDFIEFLELLFKRKRQASSYKILKIGNTQIEESLSTSIDKTEDRLYSYFKDIQPKNKRILDKRYKSIIENITNNQEDLDIPRNYLNTFYLALRNLFLNQIELNKVKSLVNSGSTLKEAINSVVTNKSKRSSIERLIRKHQAMAIKLEENRRRLY